MQSISPSSTTAHDSPALAGDPLDLCGCAYKPGGLDPSGFDCWGLVLWVYRQHFGINLPIYCQQHPETILAKSRLFEKGVESPDWTRLKEPENGCVVAMSRGGPIHHAGVWLDIGEGICLHVYQHGYVSGHSVQQLKSQGYNRIEFFQWSKFLESATPSTHSKT